MHSGGRGDGESTVKGLTTPSRRGGSQRNAATTSESSSSTSARASSSSTSSSTSSYFDWQDLMVFFVCLIHIFASPFTKVEESFSLQAIHDILYNGRDIEKYDHFEFPGVVPRTFIGPLIVAAIASPFNFAFKLLGLPKLYSLYLVRMVLGLFLTLSFGFFRKGAERKFGVGAILSLIFCSEFHLMFYMSRTLPNTFALALVLIGFGFWLRRGESDNWWKGMIFTFTFTVAVYRSEVILLVAPILLQVLVLGHVGFFDLIKCGIVSSVISVALTVFVDSVMWQRWIWPELEVFWYNTYHNQSHRWGVFPFHWYWTSALPRALMGALPLALLGILIDRRVRFIIAPTLIFIFFYSFLPHKELRFIFYALPIFNLSAAVAISRLQSASYDKDDEEQKKTNKGKRSLYRLLLLCAIGLLALSALASAFSLFVSSHNYPGGYALKALHTLEHDHHTKDLYNVHIDVYSAMTGVSRFGELHSDLPNWKYSKAEDLNLEDYQQFTHLLTANETFLQTHEILAEIQGFDRINLSKSFLQQPILTSTKVYILKKRK